MVDPINESKDSKYGDWKYSKDSKYCDWKHSKYNKYGDWKDSKDSKDSYNKHLLLFFLFEASFFFLVF